MARYIKSSLRSFATLTKHHYQTPVTLTTEGAVSISYATLTESPLTLQSSIGAPSICCSGVEINIAPLSEKAFGSDPKALGIIIVRDLPEDLKDKRERLLKLADKFAGLDETVREKYADAKSRYRCEKITCVTSGQLLILCNTQLWLVSWEGT